MISQLDDFLSLAQSGQEMSAESLWPAEIQFAGSGAILACSGGVFRRGEDPLVAGGFEIVAEIVFRLRKELLAGNAPAIGGTLSWRRQGEHDWRGTLRIVHVGDSPASPVFVLACSAPHQ